MTYCIVEASRCALTRFSSSTIFFGPSPKKIVDDENLVSAQREASCKHHPVSAGDCGEIEQMSEKFGNAGGTVIR